MTEIDVACVPSSAQVGGWTCSVRVRDDHGATEHEVDVRVIDVPEGLAGATGEPDLDAVERLVDETFDFLLEREPKEAILRRFALNVVEQYFPEFPREIRRRLAR
jgi:hypothetical protein